MPLAAWMQIAVSGGGGGGGQKQVTRERDVIIIWLNYFTQCIYKQDVQIMEAPSLVFTFSFLVPYHHLLQFDPLVLPIVTHFIASTLLLWRRQLFVNAGIWHPFDPGVYCEASVGNQSLFSVVYIWLKRKGKTYCIIILLGKTTFLSFFF